MPLIVWPSTLNISVIRNVILFTSLYYLHLYNHVTCENKNTCNSIDFPALSLKFVLIDKSHQGMRTKHSNFYYYHTYPEKQMFFIIS